MRLPDEAVAGLAAPHPAAVQAATQLLVQRHPVRQLVTCGAAELAQVELHAEVARQGHRGGEAQALGAAGGVGRRGAHVGTHDLGREELQEAALDVHP